MYVAGPRARVDTAAAAAAAAAAKRISHTINDFLKPQPPKLQFKI